MEIKVDDLLQATIVELESDIETIADHNIQLKLALNDAVLLLHRTLICQMPFQLKKEILEFIDDFEVEE